VSAASLRNAGLVVAGVLCALLVAEVGLRLGRVTYLNFSMVVADEQRGWALRPGVEGWLVGEGVVHIRINSAGFRDRERAIRKPPNTLRVAILGDSMTMGGQVAESETFSAVVERELAACPRLGGRAVEALNFGVDGYSTAQELMTLRYHAWQYAPDIVVLAVYTGNDIVNNFLRLDGDAGRPYFVRKNGALVLDASFRDSPWYRFRKAWVGRVMSGMFAHSRLLQVVLRARKVVRERLGRRVADPEYALYKVATDPNWIEAWQVTEGLLVAVRHEVAKHAARLLVVTLSNGIQVHPDKSRREKFLEDCAGCELFYPDVRIRDLGERYAFRVVNLAPTLQSLAEQKHMFLHGPLQEESGDGHWNVEGHRLAGHLIAREICGEMDRRPVGAPSGVR